jgi:hypothetical protein
MSEERCSSFFFHLQKKEVRPLTESGSNVVCTWFCNGLPCMFARNVSISFLPMALQPKSGFGLLLWGFLITFRHDLGLDSSGRVISRRRGLYLYKATHRINTSDKHPCPQPDSNPRSQQPSGRRPTPYVSIYICLFYLWSLSVVQTIYCRMIWWLMNN